MKARFSPELLGRALLLSSILAPQMAISQNTEVVSESLEEVTIYGRHNQLILESGTATKSNMQLMETPAAVVVVDRELFDNQGVDTLQDSIRNVSGLSQAGNNYGIGDNLQIRGLGANYTYDGMYAGAGLGNSYNPTRSTTNVQSIEVLKGPATGLYGIGSAGGVINLVEKKPQFEELFDVQLSAGEWANYGVMLDYSNAINDDAAFRLVVNHEQEDGFRDLSSERSEVYGSLQFNLNDSNTLLISTAFVEDENQIDSVGDPIRILNWDDVGLAAGSSVNAADLPNDSNADGDSAIGLQLTDEQRQALASSIVSGDGINPFDLGSNSLISPLSRPNEGSEKRLKIRLDTRFGEKSKLTQQLLYRQYDSKFVRQTGAYNYVYWNRRGEINNNPRAPLVIDGVLYPYAARRQEYRKQESEESTWQYFADLSHAWQGSGIRGEHLVSVNIEKREMELKSWSIYDADSNPNGNAVPYILDIRTPNWGTGEFEDYDPSLRTNYVKNLTAYGIGLQEVLYFNEKLTGRFGAAYTRTEQDYQHRGSDRTPGVGEESDTDDAGHSFNVGLNYRMIPEFALFANLSQGRTVYSVLGSLSASDNPPDSESESLDIGIRFTAFNENLLGSVVWFDTARTNLRYGNPLFNDTLNDPEYNISVSEYRYNKEDETRGWEMDLNMELSQSFSLNLNGTYQDAIEITGNEKTAQRKGIPKRSAGVWGRYKIPLEGASIEFSLGAKYTGKRTANSASFGLPTSYLPSHEVFDAAVSYQNKNLNVRLNIENIKDEAYYDKAMFLGGLQGNSRNAQLTARYSF